MRGVPRACGCRGLRWCSRLPARSRAGAPTGLCWVRADSFANDGHARAVGFGAKPEGVRTTESDRLGDRGVLRGFGATHARARARTEIPVPRAAAGVGHGGPRREPVQARAPRRSVRTL